MNKVSIIIPTFNQDAYISKCISSALSQNYQNLEVILSDDCSSDLTKSIASKFTANKKFKYFRNSSNLGRLGNYRKSLNEYAKGVYILNLDADDWLTDRNYISKAVSILDKDPSIGFVTATNDVYQEENNLLLRKRNCSNKLFIYEGKDYLVRHCKKELVFSHLSSLYRKKDGLKYSFYNIDSPWSDAISFFRLALNSKVAYLDKSIGVWRVHNENASSLSSDTRSPKLFFADLAHLYGKCNFFSYELINTYKLEAVKSFFNGSLRYLRVKRAISMIIFLLVYETVFFRRNILRIIMYILKLIVMWAQKD